MTNWMNMFGYVWKSGTSPKRQTNHGDSCDQASNSGVPFWTMVIFFMAIVTSITLDLEWWLDFSNPWQADPSNKIIGLWLTLGKNTKNYGKSPFQIGKSTIFMAIFDSYVCLPEGNLHDDLQQSSLLMKIWHGVADWFFVPFRVLG